MASRILVVDDEPAVREMVTRALRDDGHEVVSVADGRVALGRASQGDIDLVITNSRMPGMSGAELIAILSDRFPGLPLLHIDDPSQTTSREHRVPDDVVTLNEPFSPTSLRVTVEGLLARKR